MLCLDETPSSCSLTRRGPSSSDRILTSSGGRAASAASISPSSGCRRGGSPTLVLEQRSCRYLEVRGRLKAGVSLEQARQEVASIARGLEQTYPDTNRNFGMLIRTPFEARLDERGAAAPTAMMLMTLAFAVLLVACANVAGLLMSRAPAREKEMALRLAIGGSRFRITRQVITESVLLACGGGALGLAMGYGGVLLLRRLPIIIDICGALSFLY